MNRPTTSQLAAVMIASTLAAAPLAAAVIEEVIVTAQKREQTLQDVANPVTVFSGAELRGFGVREPRDIAEQTPGLLAKYGPNGLSTVSFYMRGVGINDFTGTVDSSVGVYVDEVFKATPDMFNFAVFDIERVEVLKGPQGTLYGRNSTGGAVNFISAGPTREPEGYARAGYSRFGTVTLEGALSGPLAETLSGRIAFSGQESDAGSGYSFNRFTGNELGDNDSISVRAHFLWEPRDDFEARVIYTWGYLDSEQPLLEHVAGLDPAALAGGAFTICGPVIAGRRAEGPCVGPTGYFDPDSDEFDSDANIDPTFSFEGHGIVGKFEWQLPRFTITSISGFDDFDKSQTQDIDSTPFVIGDNETIDTEVEAFSQEVRVTSDESWPFSWMFGGFYFDSSIDWFQTIDLSDVAIPTSNGAKQDTESWAVFAHGSLPLDRIVPFGERFEIEGGVRFTHEERTWRGGSFIGTFAGLEEALGVGAPALSALPIPPGGTVGGDLPGGPMDFDNKLKEDNVDFRVALKFRPDDEKMFYVAISEAFRSGGVSGAVIFSQEAVEPFDAESLRSYEGGFKLNLAGGRGQLNANAFYYEFENYQATFIRATEVSARLQNAGDVEILGVEVTAKWLFGERLLVDGGFTWLDNEITKTDVVLPPLDGGAPGTIEGNEIANAPEFSLNGRVRYQFPDWWTFTPQLQFDFTWVDDHFLEPNNRKVLKENGYFILNGRLTLVQGNGPWEIAAWVRNLNDESYVTAAQDVFLALGFSEQVRGAPRTFGVEVGYRF